MDQDSIATSVMLADLGRLAQELDVAFSKRTLASALHAPMSTWWGHCVVSRCRSPGK